MTLNYDQWLYSQVDDYFGDCEPQVESKMYEVDYDMDGNIFTYPTYKMTCESCNTSCVSIGRCIMINFNLTKRETQIYNAICIDGVFRVADLMKRFDLSFSTISTHLNHIYQKKLVHSLAELIWKHYQGE